MCNLSSVIRNCAIATVNNKLMRHENDGYITSQIKTHREGINLKAKEQLQSLGYSKKDITHIQRQVIPEYIHNYEKIFHCDFSTRAQVKSECKDLYRRIVITRYRRLYDFLVRDVGTMTGTHCS
tara:strand:- start:471 stop:842 length:372 start_codon:yes stop_codon:yes gene_type:complete